MFKSLLAAAFTAVLAFGALPSAAATVNMTNGGMYTLQEDAVFNFTDQVADTGGMLSFGFDGTGFVDGVAATLVFDPLSPAAVQATFLQTMWSSEQNGGGTIFADSGVQSLTGGTGSTELSTVFADASTQWFTAWFDGTDGSGLVNVQVNATPVPLPAAGWLLLGGLGGLGGLSALRRRKRAA